MNFFQPCLLFIIISIELLATNGPVVCDALNDVELTGTGDVFWDWIFGSDTNQTDERKPLDHIKEELDYHYRGVGLGDTLSGTDSEVDFHVFNLHDFDKNRLLDGLEMLAMLERHDDSRHIHPSAHTLDQNIAAIDLVLSSEDTNNDGFLDYNEFRRAKTRHDLKGI